MSAGGKNLGRSELPRDNLYAANCDYTDFERQNPVSTEQLYTNEGQRDPFFLVAILEGQGVVVTRAGRYTIDEAAYMLVDHLGRFDWQAWKHRDRLDERAFGEIFDAIDYLYSIVKLVAQVNLYQARLLWCLNAPESVGLPRILDKAYEASELTYHRHLAALRARVGDEVTDYVLTHGAEILEWESQRCEFVTRGNAYGARLAAAA
jgi:hypothetical protein